MNVTENSLIQLNVSLPSNIQNGPEFESAVCLDINAASTIILAIQMTSLLDLEEV